MKGRETKSRLLDAAEISRELGVSRKVAEKIMRQLPKVKFPDAAKVYVKRQDLERYIEENTFDIVSVSARRGRTAA